MIAMCELGKTREAERQRDAAVAALKHIRNSLHEANEGGAIADTIWAGPAETLWDYIDEAIKECGR
jgi:hypothetical protein